MNSLRGRATHYGMARCLLPHRRDPRGLDCSRRRPQRPSWKTPTPLCLGENLAAYPRACAAAERLRREGRARRHSAHAATSTFAPPSSTVPEPSSLAPGAEKRLRSMLVSRPTNVVRVTLSDRLSPTRRQGLSGPCWRTNERTNSRLPRHCKRDAQHRIEALSRLHR